MPDPWQRPVPGQPFVPNARQTGLFLDAARFAQLHLRARRQVEHSVCTGDMNPDRPNARSNPRQVTQTPAGTAQLAWRWLP